MPLVAPIAIVSAIGLPARKRIDNGPRLIDRIQS